MSQFGEPWTSGYARRIADIARADGTCVMWEIPEEMPPAYLERIVACVNFCRQIPTEFLEGKQLEYPLIYYVRTTEPSSCPDK